LLKALWVKYTIYSKAYNNIKKLYNINHVVPMNSFQGNTEVSSL